MERYGMSDADSRGDGNHDQGNATAVAATEIITTVSQTAGTAVAATTTAVQGAMTMTSTTGAIAVRGGMATTALTKARAATMKEGVGWVRKISLTHLLTPMVDRASVWMRPMAGMVKALVGT